MKPLLTLILTTLLLPAAYGQDFKTDAEALIQSACIHCHDESTDTDLNFDSLDHDLSDPDTFRMWEKIFDRTSSGEMPPPSEDRPDADELKAALSALKKDLHDSSIAKQKSVGRTPARRLTKLELGYTIQDLLLIDNDVTGGIPDEVDAGTFDTVGANQRISALHLESYLEAVDKALHHAIRLDNNPYRDFGDHADKNFPHLDEWHKKPLQDGGSVTRKLKYGTGVALFRDTDYLTQFTYNIHTPGIYRLTATAAAFQSRKPITGKIIVKNPSGSARVAKSIELLPGEPQTFSVDTFLSPGDNPYLTYQTDKATLSGVFAAGGAKNYKGPGLAILKQRVEGPIFESWPTRIQKRRQSSKRHSDLIAFDDDLAAVPDVQRRSGPA